MTIPIDRLEAICRIPEDLPRKSLAELVSESGFREMRPELRRESLVPYLTRHPSLVLAWLRYSKDKRTSGGWYLMQQEAGWIVGQLGGLPQERETRFETAPEACAEFVLRELDSVVAGSNVPPK